MRVFVTGGSGFVGGHVIERLAKRHEVLALARSEASAKAVSGFGAKSVDGELGQVKADALAGVDVIVHSAAWVKSFGTREQFWAGNVEGTQQLLDVARRAGVKRFVHIGTEAALFTGQSLVDVDESRPLPTRHRYLYSETKAEAERRVRAANTADFTTLVLRPRLVWGPRDGTVVPEVRDAVNSGVFAWIGGGQQRTSTCFVHNLALAVELALTRGRGGEAYFIADDETHVTRDFVTALLGAVGVTMPDRSIPAWLARPLASFVDTSFSVLRPGRKAPMSAFGVHMLASEMTVSTRKAREELGYQPEVSFSVGLELTRTG